MISSDLLASARMIVNERGLRARVLQHVPADDLARATRAALAGGAGDVAALANQLGITKAEAAALVVVETDWAQRKDARPPQTDAEWEARMQALVGLAERTRNLETGLPAGATARRFGHVDVTPQRAPSVPQLELLYRPEGKLGEGAYKDAYGVEGRPDLVLVVERATRHTLQREHEAYAQLAAVGIPVPRVYEVGTFEGRPAAIVERLPGHSTYTQRTVDDAREILAILDRHGLALSDPELMLREDGAIVVYDPGDVVSAMQCPHDARRTRGVVEGALRGGLHALQRR